MQDTVALDESLGDSAALRAAPAALRGWGLRCGERVRTLRVGRTVIGRSASCDVVLDDQLVSRRHASIEVRDGVARVEDLGSVNGVYLNGERLTAAGELRAGDRLVIGRQELLVEVAAEEAPRSRAEARTLADFAGRAADSEVEATRRGDAFELLGGVVDKVLALGRGPEAERIIGGYLAALGTSARESGRVDPALAVRAAEYAISLAEATRKGTWVDYAIDLYAVNGAPLPAALVDRLYSVVRRVSRVDVGALRGYAAMLKSRQGGLGPAERFLVQRIEGLASLAALR